MIRFSPLEQVVFIILVIISVYLFWMRFGKVWGNIRASKNDPGFSIKPVGRSVLTFIWEVVLQAKVIRQRPLPGLAHALVFWGFCAFALVTINHFALGFGVPFLSRESWFGWFYLDLAAVFAVVVSVSIAGLAIRRFAVRPRWLGEVSYESGAIALLILALMTTYLAALWVDDTSAAAKFLWWAHTLVILA